MPGVGQIQQGLVPNKLAAFGRFSAPGALHLVARQSLKRFQNHGYILSQSFCSIHDQLGNI